MSMLTINGVLVNVYTAPAAKREGSEEKDKIQILGEVPLQNGEHRKELVTITVPDANKYKGREGEEIKLPVGVFSPNKGSVIFFVVKAA